MNHAPSWLLALALLLLPLGPSCDSNPTPHPWQYDVSGGETGGIANEPNDGDLESPTDDIDRDPSAGADAGPTGGFSGDAGPMDGQGESPDAAPDVEPEVTPPGSDNAAACPGESYDPDDDFDPDGEGRLED